MQEIELGAAVHATYKPRPGPIVWRHFRAAVTLIVTPGGQGRPG